MASQDSDIDKFSRYKFQRKVRCTNCYLLYKQVHVEICNLCADVVCRDCIQQGHFIVDECGWINVHKPEKGNLHCKEYEKYDDVFHGGELYYTCSFQCLRELIEGHLSDRTLSELGLTDGVSDKVSHSTM